MSTTSVEAKLVQKIRAVILALPDVSKYVGTRVYPAHISTISDRVFPAVSIYILPSGPPDVDGFGGKRPRLQIDLWFNGVGKNCFTWDNVVEAAQAIVNAMHRTVLTDNTIGIKVIESTCEDEGGQMLEDGGKVLHWPLRFRFRAALP